MSLVFEGFELDPEGRRLLRDGVEVPLERRALELLFYLALHPLRLVSKDELLAEVWRAKVLSDGVLSNTISKLRRAIRQGTDDDGPIQTVHGLGYRWCAREPTRHESVVPPPRIPHEALPDDPFVGRDDVLSSLATLVHGTAQGRGRLVLIQGEAGIGKTRTLGRLLDQARTQGLRTLLGSAYEGGGAPAFLPWLQIARAIRQELGVEKWQYYLPDGPGALASLLAEGPATEASEGPDGQTLRFRLFDEMTRLLAALCEERPLLLAFEDLHFADRGTIDLLDRTSRALEGKPVLFAATSRAHEGHLESLGRLERTATRIALSGLSTGDVSRLALALGARPESTLAIDALCARTAGNPFFVRQLVELELQRAGETGVPDFEAGPLPTAVREVVLQRLRDLVAEEARVLHAASVLGLKFHAGFLARMLDLGEEDVILALEPARRLHVVRAEPGSGVFSFTHAIVREALYGELGLPLAGALHARAALSLEEQRVTDAERLGELARHSLLSLPLDLEATVLRCERAAAAARNLCGFEVAAEVLSLAVQKLQAYGGQDRRQAELLLLVVLDRFCSGEVEASWRALRQGQLVARRSGERGLLGQFACCLAGWMPLGGVDEEDVRDALDEALLGLPESDTLRPELLARRATLSLELTGNERTRLLDVAEGLAKTTRNPDGLLAVTLARASRVDPGRVDEARVAVEHCRALIGKRPQKRLEPAHWLHGFQLDFSEYTCALLSFELDLADEIAARFSSRAKRFQTGSFMVVAELMRAGRELAERRLDRLEGTVARLQQSSQHFGGLGRAWVVYAFHLSDARGETEAWAQHDPMNAEVMQQLLSAQRLDALVWIAWFFARTGRPERARGLLQDVPKRDLQRMPSRYGDLGTLSCLAEVYAATGDSDGATWLHAVLLPHAAMNTVGPALDYRGPVSRNLTLLAPLLNGASPPDEGSEEARRAAVLSGKALNSGEAHLVRRAFAEG